MVAYSATADCAAFLDQGHLVLFHLLAQCLAGLPNVQCGRGGRFVDQGFGVSLQEVYPYILETRSNSQNPIYAPSPPFWFAIIVYYQTQILHNKQVVMLPDSFWVGAYESGNKTWNPSVAGHVINFKGCTKSLYR